ncbi:MAG TPA: hypothetical protein VG106_08610 [Vicinamibacterales bacterium]|nr:hypothetical protein [Vicinamibacterales bacterium]
MNIRSVVMAAAVGCTLITTTHLSAQGTEPQATSGKTARWEFVLPGGAIVPTGVQRDAIKRGNLTAVQLTYVARPAFAITSTLGWARSRDIATAGDPKLDVFTYDVGAEVRAPRWLAGKAMTFSPFAGVGAGGRSYNYRKLDVAATHNVAAYASAGGELGYRRVRVRLEARDYVTGFKPLDGAGAARTGNDIVVMAGLRLVSR